MLDNFSIVKLYQNVLDRDIDYYRIPQEAIAFGIESMTQVYHPNLVNLNSARSVVADYNDVAHRCAYLHKFAALHTAMVRDLLFEAVSRDFDFFAQRIFAESSFKICSIGGGPGSDAIGVLAALYSSFSYFHSSVTVVDYMINWSYAFESILSELRNGWYGPFGQNMCYLNTQYIGANLLKPLTPEVLYELNTASLVTMIKFVSAAACQDTQLMMRNVFRAMKPGALVLYIDNDGGGFHQIFMDSAIEFNFISIYGPERHKNYINTDLLVKKFGYNSCCKTTVVIHILQKPFIMVQPYQDFRRNMLHENYFVPESPLTATPLLFRPDDTLCIDPCQDQDEYNVDECINSNGFRLPYRDIPQSPFIENGDWNIFTHSPVMSPSMKNTVIDRVMGTPIAKTIIETPIGNSKRHRKRVKGCIKVPFKNIRQRVALKAKQIKSNIKQIRKKIKHPIFRL